MSLPKCDGIKWVFLNLKNLNKNKRFDFENSSEKSNKIINLDEFRNVESIFIFFKKTPTFFLIFFFHK